MKPIRKEYPRIRRYVKHGKTYYRVDLRRKHYVGVKTQNFTNLEDAKTFAKGIAEKVVKQGLNSIATIGTDSRVKVWAEQCAFFGKTVEDAISLALKQFASEKSKMETPYASELLSVWLDDKISNPLKPLRPRSLKEIRKMANVFKKQFGTMRIAEINAQYVEHFIKGKAVSNRSRKNILSYLSQFFNWAIKKQHITISNPAKHIEITVTTGTPQFFTVEQCEEILSKVSGNVVMPYFAICLFAGVRPDEAKRMTWGNINLKSNEISLPASITKTKRPRLFEMEPNLVEWLKKANKEEPLIAVNLRKLSAKALLGLSFDWIQDGMRHSFATFYHAKPNSSLDDLRKIMGNSPSVIEKFYKGTITKSEVEKFWNITPDSIQKKEACSNASAGA